jgi:hypothetical protein
VTITNAAAFVPMLVTALALSGRPLRRVPRDSAVLTLAMLVATAALTLAGRVVAHDTPWPLKNAGNHATNYLKSDWAKAPAALLETFSPPELVSSPMPEVIRKANLFSSGRDAPVITTAPTAPAPLVAFVTALTVSGAVACLRAGNPLRTLGAASLTLLAFNLVLHSVWGDAFFLYSQHWLVPLAVLLAGNLTWPGLTGRAFTAVYAAAGVAMFFHNAALLNRIFDALAAGTA